MRPRPLKRWTLRELLSESDKICRELVEHYKQDYYNVSHDLEKLIRPHKTRPMDVADITIVNTVKKVAKSEQYGTDLVNRLEEILGEIHNHVDRDM